MLPTLLIFSLLLILALLPTLYVQRVLCKDWNSRWRPVLWLPFAFIVLSLLLLALFVYRVFFLRLFAFMVLCVIAPALVLTVVSGIGWLLARKWPQVFRWGNYTAYLCCAVTFCAMLYGLCWGWSRLEVKQVNLSFENLPEAFDGYRIVQLTDLHVGSYGTNTDFVERVVERTNALQPDMIVFTGDLINLQADEIVAYEPILSRLHARDGVYAVLGNHDYCRYGFDKSQAEQQAQLQRVREAEARMGWQLLEDTNVRVGRGIDTIVIAGVGCVSPSSRFRDGDLNKALQDVPDSLFTILLSHDPSHWRMEVLDHSAVVLTLSGHTHAAQMKIGSWSPAAMIYKEWSGLYESTIHHTPYTIHRYLYVSEGLGGTFPFRLGTTPQIVEITLQNIK